MSILIKGQELPTSCGDCKKQFLIEGRNRCPFLWRNFGDNSEYQNKKRMPDCPLVEVHEPHGRLIDADELEIERGNYETYNDYSEAFDMIDNAPTVIEAEEKEHERSKNE